MICLILSISAYSQNIDSLKAEINSLKARVEALEQILLNRNDSSLVKKNSLVQEKRCAATTASGSQCSRNAESGSNYCWQHKKMYENNTTTQVKPTTSSSSTTSREIHTGSRGGKYYINSKGNKVYIKK